MLAPFIYKKDLALYFMNEIPVNVVFGKRITIKLHSYFLNSKPIIYDLAKGLY